MSKFIFLTNIPTPYRTNFYNSLEESKLNFEVFYMRNIEADRNWVINFDDIKKCHKKILKSMKIIIQIKAK